MFNHRDGNRYYLGLMSGTSADGIDLALVDMQTSSPKLVAYHFVPYPKALFDAVTALYKPSDNEIDRLGSLSVSLANAYANAIHEFLAHLKIDSHAIIAIGNHGQTIRHRPSSSQTNNQPFTLQIGCNQVLATLTNIRVIGDFRTKDMAYGGQGAPLVPAFHRTLFPNVTQDCFLINIGGIANITFLPADSSKPVLGFDTGPGNALLDAWCQYHQQGKFDDKGQWSSTGKVNTNLLNQLLNDPYFNEPAPKSTGREYFHLAWLEEKLAHIQDALLPQDVQATLSALTATSIANEIKRLSSDAVVYVVGGGSLNITLINMLKTQLSLCQFLPLNAHNLVSDAVEAMAFAWFAYAYDKKIYGNIPAVTGASKEVVLGVEYTP